VPTTNIFIHTVGRKSLELSNHLGSVLTTVSDRKLGVDNNSDNIVDFYLADVRSATDMYSGGMQMPGRSYNANAYRYGFGTQEKDDEITGNSGSHYTATFWEYDTRLGRRWNLDPKPTIGVSDYATFLNNPIWYNDPLGDKVEYKDRETKKSVREARRRDADFNAAFKKLKKDREDTYHFEKTDLQNQTLPNGAENIQNIKSNVLNAGTSNFQVGDSENGIVAGVRDNVVLKFRDAPSETKTLIGASVVTNKAQVTSTDNFYSAGTIRVRGGSNVGSPDRITITAPPSPAFPAGQVIVNQLLPEQNADFSVNFSTPGSLGAGQKLVIKVSNDIAPRGSPGAFDVTITVQGR